MKVFDIVQVPPLAVTDDVAPPPSQLKVQVSTSAIPGSVIEAVTGTVAGAA